jgi:hypothetical protein
MASGERGGPPTIGNFVGKGPENPNGMPQLATAGAYAYRVFDLQCTASNGCQDAARFIRWAQPSQDCSSGATGSTIFDFEGDGKAEAIYADECFVRVYDGKTGDVLFSQAHATATWWSRTSSPTLTTPTGRRSFRNAAEGERLFQLQRGTPDRTQRFRATAPLTE